MKAEVEFQIVESTSDINAVLGLPTLIELNLVKRVESIQNDLKLAEPLDKYKDLFSGLGNINGYYYITKVITIIRWVFFLALVMISSIQH